MSLPIALRAGSQVPRQERFHPVKDRVRAITLSRAKIRPKRITSLMRVKQLLCGLGLNLLLARPASGVQTLAHQGFSGQRVVAAGPADLRQDFLDNPILETLRLRHIAAHDETVEVGLGDDVLTARDGSSQKDSQTYIVIQNPFFNKQLPKSGDNL